MELYRIGFKFFLANPESLRERELVPVFHTWIQKQAIPGHLFLDVHDYSHIHWGPGILLVGHEGNFSMDLADGKPGLLYYRKQPLNGASGDPLTAILKTALEGCSLLEQEPFETPLRFRANEFVIVSNDRLLAPNDPETLAQLEPALSTLIHQIVGKAEFKLKAVATNPKERFSVRVEVEQSASLKDFLCRL